MTKNGRTDERSGRTDRKQRLRRHCRAWRMHKNWPGPRRSSCAPTLSEKRTPRVRAVSDACQISFSSMASAGVSSRKTMRVGMATSVRSPMVAAVSRRHSAITRCRRKSTWPIRMLAASQFLGSFFARLLFGCKQQRIRYNDPPFCPAEMYAGRVVCCPLVSQR